MKNIQHKLNVCYNNLQRLQSSAALARVRSFPGQKRLLLEQRCKSIAAAQQRRLQAQTARLQGAARLAAGLNPYAVLGRGYGIARTSGGKTIDSVKLVQPGQHIALTLRDGNHSENVGIPYLVHQLDTLARAIVKEFNAIHNAGYPDPRSGAADGNGADAGYGIDFFDDYGDNYDKITAGTFKLDDDMTDPEDVWRIACSDVEITDSNQEGNNHNTIDRLLDKFSAKDVGDISNFTDFYNSFLLTIGFTTDFARTQYTNRETLATSSDTQRMSISAVSIDEEMVNMVKFQHAFAASSRVITAMDEALDRIINSTGVVGR